MIGQIDRRRVYLFLAVMLLASVAVAVVTSSPWLQDVIAEEPDTPAQTSTLSTRAAPVSLQRSPASTDEIESIAGSGVTTAECYQPATAQVICFTVTNGSPDSEWLNRVRLTFPNYTGLGPWIASCGTQDATDSNSLTVNMSCSASSNVIVYEDSDNTFDAGIGEVSGGATWGFCVNVTVPTGYNGSRYVQWGLRGDGTGALPHEVFGSTEIQMCTPLMLRPDSVTAEGCNGMPRNYVFELWNNTGSSGTFDLAYNVPSGNGTLSGLPSFSLLANEVVTFTAVLTPDLCMGAGDQVLATVQASGSGASDTSSIVQTIGDFQGWEERADSPVTSMDGAVAWAVTDGGLWSVGGYGSGGATQRYDPETDAWTLHTPESSITPTIRYPADGCYGLDAGGHEVLVLFPDTESPVTTLHRYDITSDEWDTPPVPTGFPPEGRWAMDITSLYNITGENVCYLSGGATQTGGGNANNLWAYYPDTNVTIYLGNFSHHPAGFDFHASWHVPWIGGAGAICVGGGIDAQNNVIADTQCYDLATGTFRSPNADLGPLPEPWWGMTDGWKMHNGRYQIWIANGVAQDGSLIGATAYADESTGGFVYGPHPLTKLYRLEGDGWSGHFYVEQGASGGFTHTSNQEQLVQCPACLEWNKQVNGEPWFPDLTVTTEVSNTIAVVDVFTTNQPIDLLEEWDPNKLDLVDWLAEPALGSIVSTTNSIGWSVPPGGFQVVTMTKWFHVEPCTWTDTQLVENLGSQGQELETRLVPIQKLPPNLWIESHYDPNARAGEPAFFTLEYGNAGAYENSVTITNTFPAEAPFVWADPPPDEVDPAGLWASWQTGDLAGGSSGAILVEVALDEGLEPGTYTPPIWDGIYNHAGELQDETAIEYLIAEPSGVYWEKTINDVAWYPDISLSIETFGLVTVVDQIEASPELDVILEEEWNPELLVLEGTEMSSGELLETPPGQLVWHLPTESTPAVITKTFRVQDCTWDLAEIMETLLVDGFDPQIRPVTVVKDQPALWIDSAYDESVVVGKVVTYTLIFGNEGGYESGAWIYGEFPPEAVFDDSYPRPSELNEAERWARWNVGELPRGAEGSIEIGVLIEPGLPISTPIGILGAIFNHTDVLQDEAPTNLHVVPPPPPEWIKTINGETWHPELAVTEETSGTIEIVDVFVAEYAFNFYEEWDPGKLALSGISIEPQIGDLEQRPDEGWVEWRVPPPESPTVFTITKQLHVEPCIWDATFVRELLSVADQIVEERPVFVVKDLPRLWIDSTYRPLARAGRPFTYTIDFGNLGGYESEALIAADFPAGAPFRSSEPAPFYISPDGLSVQWNTGSLGRGQTGQILVSVDIASTAEPLSTITVWDGVINHGGELEDEVWSHFLVGAKIYLPVVLRE